MEGAEQAATHLTHAGIQAQLDDEGNVSLMAPNPEVLNTVWQVCRDNQLVVKSLTPMRNSIEEIFMDAIRGDEHAHS